MTELAEPRYAGSVLALQVALGFTLTMVSIRLVPVAVDAVGWRNALLPLAAGPLLRAPRRALDRGTLNCSVRRERLDRMLIPGNG